MVPIGDYARAQREDGARIIFEEHGMTVTVLDGQPAFASVPNLVIPIFGAALNANPETKIIVHSGSDVMNVAEGIAKAHPLKRIGEGKDTAAMAKFLLTEESSWITGQIIGVDGGRSTLA